MTTKAKPDSTETKKRILIVEDHPVVVWGLQLLINGQPDLTVCGDAEDAGPALTLAESLQPDLVIVDLSLKNSHGLELIKNLRARLPAVRMLVISLHPEEEYAERCLRAGAHGYLDKQAAPTLIATAIRRVLAGHVFVSDALKSRLRLQPFGRPGHGLNGKISRLSDREFEIFELLGQGRTTDGIAAILRIAPHTVQNQYGHIREKLGVADVRQLAVLAARWVEGREPGRGQSVNSGTVEAGGQASPLSVSP